MEEIDVIKGQLNELQGSLEQVMFRSNHHFGHMLGERDYKKEKWAESFRFFIYSLANSLQLKEPLNVEPIIQRMENVVNNIKEDINYESRAYDAVIEADRIIRSLGNYQIIRKKYDSIFNKFTSKVKRYEV